MVGREEPKKKKKHCCIVQCYNEIGAFVRRATKVGDKCVIITEWC